MEAYEYEVEEERGPLNELVNYFFPVLEQHMQTIMSQNSPNQIQIMHLLSKIFWVAT